MRLFLSMTIATVLAGCGVETVTQMQNATQDIINGTPDTDPAHDAVVAVYFNHRYWSFCSGTMIAPGVVLTAAHCAYKRPKDRFEILFGPNAQDAVHRKVTSLWIHPDYDPSLLGRGDLCLMRFSGGSPVDAAPIPPLPSSLALTRQDEGKTLQFTGYGVTEKGEFTEKLTVKTVLSHVCDEAESCAGLGFSNKERTICYDQTDVGGPCSGDSGGPSFMYRDNHEYVVGVTSYGDRNCMHFGCSVKVDRYEDWINAFLTADTKQGQPCSDDLECLSGFCADGVCCDYACNSPCEACNLPGVEGTCSRVTDDSIEPGCSLDTGCSTNSQGSPGTWSIMLTLLSVFAVIWIGRRKYYS